MTGLSHGGFIPWSVGGLNFGSFIPYTSISFGGLHLSGLQQNSALGATYSRIGGLDRDRWAQ